MRSLRQPAVAVWLVLVCATVLSYLLGAGHDPGSGELAIAAVLVLAFGKTWLVGRWFMELREAPSALRGAFDAWVAVVGAAVVGMYLFA